MAEIDRLKGIVETLRSKKIAWDEPIILGNSLLIFLYKKFPKGDFLMDSNFNNSPKHISQKVGE